MSKRVVPALVSLAFVSILGCYAPEVMGQASTEQADGKGLRGFVCDQEGKPIAEANVVVNLGRKLKASRDGAFFVPHREIERQGPVLLVTVRCDRDGKELCCRRFVDYVTGRENMTFRLRDSVTVTGRVLSTDGRPIEGAEVRTYMDVGDLTCHGTAPAAKAVNSDERGRFHVPGLYPDARYTCWVVIRGWERKWSESIAVANRQQLNDRLEVRLREAPGVVAGKVVDEIGKPVAESRVIVGHPCIADAISVTDEQGRFRIEDLVPGEEVTLCVRWNFQKVNVGDENVVLVDRPRKR